MGWGRARKKAGLGSSQGVSQPGHARPRRVERARNPRTVLPRGGAPASTSPLSALSAELVGNYALRIRFSDGHDTGLFSWAYLREIDPDADRRDT